jgi:peptidyl-prolyl cis-trans isomerase SurA
MDIHEIKDNMIKKKISVAFACLFLSLFLNSPAILAEYLDRIVAVVEDDVVLDSELNQEVADIVAKLSETDVMIPPDFILRKQVLERIIIDKLQRQLAERSGIRISDEMLNSSIADIARQNNMNQDEFRQELARQGIDYQSFVESVRNEIIINQLRSREVGERIKVTDREVEHFLETHSGANSEKIKYHLGHILIAIPEAASADAIQKAKAKADGVVKKLREGKDFKQTAIGVSDGGQALKGGDLGWRTLKQMPTLFVDIVKEMGAGDVSDPIRSPSGFHIVKVLEIEGLSHEKHLVTQHKVRHILIKTNELIDDAEAKRRLLALKQRISDGDDFSTLARANSDDKASALKGGDLGWISPGALVPPFEAAMKELAIGEISDPVQTQFGWHLIQVLDRKNKDESEQYKKNKAREEIRKRKIEEETELWLRRLRDEAYVDIRLDVL